MTCAYTLSGIAGENDEIRVLSGLERSDALVEVEHLRAVDRHRLGRALARHAAANSERGASQEQA
jgi:hypothetical protein